ncbi:MAG: tetratricopeptide repeat protein [Bacteroidia bacterium]|jgi:tetratricopeptide (TPR) repeat protein
MKTRLILSFFLSVLFGSAFAKNPNTIFQEANTAYQQNNFQKANELYKNLVLEHKITSFEVYYNLANSFYRLADYPSAILFYQKALKIEPSNDDARYNLKLVQAKIEDRIERIPQLFYKRWFNSLRALCSTDTWALLFISAFMASVFFFGVFLLSKKLNRRRIGFYAFCVFLLLTLAFIVLSWSSYQHNEQKKHAVIFAGSISVKSAPVQSSLGLYILHAGTTVEIIDELGEWVKIRLEDGKEGWVILGDLEII